MLFQQHFWKAVKILLGILLITALVSLNFGSTSITLVSAFRQMDSTSIFVLFGLRLPRILYGMVIGGSLGLCGAVLQGLFRNPLATPYTLGVAGGATLGTTLALFFHAPFPVQIATAFLFSLLTIIFIYRLSVGPSGVRLASLLLAGVVANFFFSSLVLLIQYLSESILNLRIFHWLMGNLEVESYGELGIISLLLIPGWISLLTTAKGLNALSLGEETATSMGVSIQQLERKIYLVTSYIVAVTVSLTGPIGFVGLIAPHLLRVLWGVDARLILPCSILGGAILLAISDTLARTVIAPAEIPVGIITATLGGPFFLFLLWRSRREIIL